MWKEGRGARRGTRCAGARGALCVGARRAEAWGAEHRFSRSRGPRVRPAPPCAPEAWSGSTEARPAPRDETGKGRARRARRGIHTPLPGRNLLSTPHRVSHPELPEAEGTVPQKEVQKKKSRLRRHGLLSRTFHSSSSRALPSILPRRHLSSLLSLSLSLQPSHHSPSLRPLFPPPHPSILSRCLLSPSLTLPAVLPPTLPPSFPPSLPPSLPPS